MKKSRIATLIVFFVLIPLTLIVGSRLSGRAFYVTSTLVIVELLIPFFLAFEGRRPQARELVVLAVMCALAVAGRVAIPIPSFKAIFGIIMIAGIAFGPESGFLVGSLSAVVSNIFFGQGPWTPFQMLTLGMTGLLSGLPLFRVLLRKRLPLAIWGMAMGIMYSGIMDIWTVLSLIDSFSWKRYLLALSTAVPYTVTYMVSNVVFLMLTIKPIGEKLNRIQIKHGIF